MVVMVTSRARSLRDPTQQDFINAHKPQRSPNETIGFNHEDHLHRM